VHKNKHTASSFVEICVDREVDVSVCEHKFPTSWVTLPSPEPVRAGIGPLTKRVKVQIKSLSL